MVAYVASAIPLVASAIPSAGYRFPEPLKLSLAHQPVSPELLSAKSPFADPAPDELRIPVEPASDLRDRE